MAEILAKEISIKYGGKIIAKATSYSLSVNKEVVEISTLDSNGWRKIIGGMKSFSISTDSLVTRGTVSGETSYHDLMSELFNNDIPVAVIVTTGTSGDKYYEGACLITSLEQSGSAGEVITCSISFEGNGTLAQKTIV